MFHNKETDECELCPAGQYQPEAGQTSCLSCPYLSSLNKRGATKCPVPPGTLKYFVSLIHVHMYMRYLRAYIHSLLVATRASHVII